MMPVERLGAIIAACHTALRRADLDPRVRARVLDILIRAQMEARRVMEASV